MHNAGNSSSVNSAAIFRIAREHMSCALAQEARLALRGYSNTGRLRAETVAAPCVGCQMRVGNYLHATVSLDSHHETAPPRPTQISAPIPTSAHRERAKPNTPVQQHRPAAEFDAWTCYHLVKTLHCVSSCEVVHIMCPDALPRSGQVYDRRMVPSTCSCHSNFMLSSDPWPCCRRSASRSVHSRCGQRAYQANKPCLAQHRSSRLKQAWHRLLPEAPSPHATVYSNHGGHVVQSNGANPCVPKPITRDKPTGQLRLTKTL